MRANAQVIITIDADLQHNAEEIPLLLEPVLEGKADIASGSRFVAGNRRDESVPSYRRLGITMLTKVTNFVSQSTISDATTGFRAYSNHASKNSCVDAIFIWDGGRFSDNHGGI